jgi:GT2 family glycosyltransferase
MNHDLTFIIVTFNSASIIGICLDRLSKISSNIIVSDNNSNDSTLAIIKKNYPKVHLIENKQNLGFSKANNIAFQFVKTDYFAIINPDCFIDGNSVERIHIVMKQNPDIAIASAIHYAGSFNQDKSKIINKKIDYIAQKGYSSSHNDYYTTRFLSGCFMFIRKEIFDKIGFFDEGFFLYCEDNEICKRVMKNGYKLAVIKDTEQIHLSKQSTGELSPQVKEGIMWHQFGFSKCYYTECVHNRFIASLKAMRNITKAFIKEIPYYFALKEKNLKNHAIINGSLAYLIGKGAFDQNGNPRMMDYHD